MKKQRSWEDPDVRKWGQASHSSASAQKTIELCKHKKKIWPKLMSQSDMPGDENSKIYDLQPWKNIIAGCAKVSRS